MLRPIRPLLSPVIISAICTVRGPYPSTCLYEFRLRSRVFRRYGRLREIEDTLETNPAGHPEMLKALDGLEAQVEKISVPLSYADELYALRNHI